MRGQSRATAAGTTPIQIWLTQRPQRPVPRPSPSGDQQHRRAGYSEPWTILARAILFVVRERLHSLYALRQDVHRRHMRQSRPTWLRPPVASGGRVCRRTVRITQRTATMSIIHRWINSTKNYDSPDRRVHPVELVAEVLGSWRTTMRAALLLVVVFAGVLTIAMVLDAMQLTAAGLTYQVARVSGGPYRGLVLAPSGSGLRRPGSRPRSRRTAGRHRA